MARSGSDGTTHMLVGTVSPSWIRSVMVAKCQPPVPSLPSSPTNQCCISFAADVIRCHSKVRVAIQWHFPRIGDFYLLDGSYGRRPRSFGPISIMTSRSDR